MPVFYLLLKMHTHQRVKEEKLTSRSFARQAHDNKPQAGLRILATTDLHMNLTSFDYYADRAEPSIGFTRTASLIRAARQEAAAAGFPVLLFDNGDSLQGTLLGDWAAQRSGRDHPLLGAFGQLGYNAMALGNHDFSFGLSILDEILSGAPCPVLCGNLTRLDAAATWQSSTIVERDLAIAGKTHPVRIGVFSVLPPQTTLWEARHLEGRVAASDAVSTARDCAADLRSRGCDVILALAHSGLGHVGAAPMSENVAVQLAALHQVDAIVAGHTHTLLPGGSGHQQTVVDCETGDVLGKPVVMPGSAGSHLGIIDLALDHDGTAWKIAGHTCQLLAVDPTDQRPPPPEDPALVQLFANAHEQTRRQAARSVGRAEYPLHSYFSFCCPDRSLAIVADAQAAALQQVLEGTAFAGLPLLSAAAPSKFGGRAGPRNYTDVSAGPIAMRHVSDLHVFPNELSAVVVDGAQLQDWLEMSAGLFRGLSHAQDQDLIKSQGTGHNFDVMHGVSYRIDLSQPARFDVAGQIIDRSNSRVRDLTYRNRPVTAEQTFVVAMTNYRANGGGNFPLPPQIEPLPIRPLSIQSILLDYLSGRLPRTLAETPPQCFSFTPHPGRSVLLRTGPGARMHLHELARFNPEVLGLDERGFLVIRLWL